MQVLVDTSVWIDYFRTGENSQALDSLLDTGASVFSLDKHFKLMRSLLDFDTYP